MAILKETRKVAGGGMNTDDSPEYIAQPDYIEAYNFRTSGTTGQEAGDGTDIESTTIISQDLLDGINKGIGGAAFEDIRKVIYFRYNSAGNCQIVQYDLDTNAERVLFTDKTDSNGISLLPLDPQFYVSCILINERYLAYVEGKNEVGFTDLTTLSSGGYGTVLAEDLSLIKPQNLKPITGYYIDDAGKAANFLKGKLFQFTSRTVGFDYTYSTWGTWSKRIIPLEEPTPTVGADVGKNNAIVVTVDIGSIRVQTLEIATREGLFDFNIIKTIDRADITSLPFTTIDIDNEVYEAYDPATNSYSFVYYNQSLKIPVPPTQTDQFVDYIWPATAIEKLNGNIIAIAGLKTGYARPKTSVNIRAVGYNPNLSVPSSDQGQRLRYLINNAGESGSGEGNHRRRMSITFAPEPKTGDLIEIFMVDIRDDAVVNGYGYTVPSAQNNDLGNVIISLSQIVPNSSYSFNPDGTVTLTWVDEPYRTLRNVSITLNNTGSSVAKSIHGVLDNSSYQLALEYRDKYGRPFPIETDNRFIVSTPSMAQLNGLTPQITWSIGDVVAPTGAVDYQWLITKNTTATDILDVFGCVLNYKGVWDSHGNTPTLAPGTGTVGDTYQITAPSQENDSVNLGNGVGRYNTADYVVYNGKSWDVVPKTFGDLTSTGTILAIKINPLSLFNQRYSNNGVDTVLGYDYSAGDRATLHYFIDPATPATKTYINDPCVDLTVFGYDPTSYLVKLEKSSQIDVATLAGKNILLRLYSPNTQQITSATVNNATVWYEIGERFTITDGKHDTLSGVITDGDVYFKTRSYNGAIDPNNVYDLLVSDFNFSDFYASKYTSYGRPRTYYDVLDQTEEKAVIVTSQPYITGSKNNGLTRFYQENKYGESDGQTSSSKGSIQVLWQRGNTLVVIQEGGIFYIPVNNSIIEDLAEQRQVGISEKLLNTGNYSPTDFGIGNLKESFCKHSSTGYFIDPYKSEPIRVGLDGVNSISGKMSKFFKSTLALAYSQGKKMVMFYNEFYEEVQLCIQTDGGILTMFPFDPTYWEVYDDITITPADITNVSVPAHTSLSYDSATGIATYIPEANYIGNAIGNFTFNFGGVPVTKNNCLNWVAGQTDVNPFSFSPLVDRPVSTLQYSNTISVFGNDIAVPISITGGSYSINGGAYTSAAGMVNPGDIVQVRQMSSATTGVTTTATLTVSNQSAPFNVTTSGSTPLDPADYYVLRPEWFSGSGTDLDTFTYFNGTGTAVDGDPNENSRVNRVGYNQNPAPGDPSGSPDANRIIPRGSANPLLNWATDNTGASGVEAILIDFKQFVIQYPTGPNIIYVDHAETWYGSRGTGDVTVSLKTYKGGTMVFNPTTKDFDHVGGTAGTINNITLNVNVVNQNNSSVLANAQKVVRVSFNKTTTAADLILL